MKKEVYQQTKYVPTKILAVDMVASCVEFYRTKMLPLKTIYLKGRLYTQFMDWVKRCMGEEKFESAKATGKLFEFDGVNIDKGSKFMLQDIYWDFYEKGKA